MNEMGLSRTEKKPVASRNEFLFLYDIKNGNPNGDPDENRPRIDWTSGRCYVTDVRLKRFIRDYLIDHEMEDQILVTTVGDRRVNLTDRVKDRLQNMQKEEFEGENMLPLLKRLFLDLRMFGNPLAFKAPPSEWGEAHKLTGPIQINFGQTIHKIKEITFHGTSVFRSRGEAEKEAGKMGTFTTYYGIPYGLIAFHGVVNEHAAKTTGLTQADLELFKEALWKGVREATSANTRTKMGQQPRLLVNIVYKEKIKWENGKEFSTDFHIGRLDEKIKIKSLREGIVEEESIRSLSDFSLDFSPLVDAIELAQEKITRVEYCASPELDISLLLNGIREKAHKVEVKDIDIDKLHQRN